VDGQDIAPRLMEPGQHDQPVARDEVGHGACHFGADHDPRFRCALVALQWSGRQLLEW
jgi:hypothetical protein